MYESMHGKSTLSSRKPRILVAPLDWGLGHATRMIPLVKELLAQDCEVWIATEGSQESLLKTEFPGEINFLLLKGYNAKYSRTKAGLLLQMLIQSSRFLQAIKREHVWLKHVVNEYGFDAVISDNRYGLWHPTLTSVFITHQLKIKSPLGKWSEKLLQGRNYRFVNRFTECWIPDNNQDGLAGDLSHPTHLPKIPARYIGHLSRFHKNSIELVKGHVLIIISGPEPQRTIFENKIITQISNHIGTVTIVRGLPGEASLIPSTNMLRFYNHLPTDLLSAEMHKAEFIISRSGYSTIMDIAALEKKSILVPTPGQTEQEYLAKYLLDKQFALTVTQKDFRLDECLEKAGRFPYRLHSFQGDSALQANIRLLIEKVRAVSCEL